MKKIFSLLALVLFINLFTYQAQAQTAVVNINKTSVSLKELIQEVEKQAGYLFVYGKDINIDGVVLPCQCVQNLAVYARVVV